MPSLTVDAAALALGILVTTSMYLSRKKGPYANLPLPPGPKRKPVIGNLLDMPKDHEWLVYEKWGKEYNSDILHVDVFGTHIVIVNSAKIANELFEKRSSLYSDRPILRALTSILKLEWVLGFVPYGQKWRDVRKAFHAHFHPTATLQYHGNEIKATHRLLRGLLEQPDDFMDHLRGMAGEIILSIAYGIDVQPRHDPYVDTAEKTLQSIALGATVGGIFDLLPALVNAPEWFPGASFKKEAKKWIPYNIGMVEDPYRYTKKAVAEGTAPPSVASLQIAQLEPSSDEYMAKHLPANMYLAGADTTVSALGTFFLAMCLFPEAQRKAQAEIDAVIGTDRLPEFGDEASLPYVDALVKEVLRWRQVVPLAIPHKVVADDVYEGYWIPAGSIVIGNSWAILHDESVFPEPDKFKPEHFLDPSVKYPEAAFGFGRRICPGRFMARASVWIAIASMLATFDISKALDENGNEIDPVDDYTSGIVS
ncbi:CyP450 monooxygenase [Dentipellis sp. KUC8613]|nr:CyP450 monooxygenase [Dentipellis sp. KUC8613]